MNGPSRLTNALVIALGAILTLALQQGVEAQDSVPGEYVVLLRKDAVNVARINAMSADQRQEELEGLASKLLPERNATVTRTFGLVNGVGIRIPEEQVAPPDKMRVELMATLNEDVELIEPNYIYYQDGAEDAPMESDPRIGDMWFLERISAPQAWTVRNGSPDVIVAVVDTGVFMGHEDLQGNIWTNQAEANGQDGVDDDHNGIVDDVHGYDFFNDDPDPSADLVTRPNGVKEYEAHGTHVAGTIGAVANSKGIVGITRRVQIMPLKFLGGPRGSGSTIDAIAAIDYAVQNGAQVINNSWGGGGRSVALQRAIERANSAGVLFPAAAGNGGFDGVGDDNDADPHFPSSYDSPNIIAVAATNESNPEDLTTFSNFGAVSVDLAAPGQQILSTVPTGNNAAGPESGYAFFSGTSMATPIVSGTVALMMAEFPTMNHLAIRELILQNVDEVPALQGRVATNGRLNMNHALRPPTPTETPGVAAAGQPAEAAAADPTEAAKASLRPAFNAKAQSRRE
ncbi:S8 family peptidase [Maioricimonas sp. JC845]|uniref:S8 family peptidase n=1 Tax=Maioricimonas sp. JC845 TaxID=3232138 RepID=UPI003457FC57